MRPESGVFLCAKLWVFFVKINSEFFGRFFIKVINILITFIKKRPKNSELIFTKKTHNLAHKKTPDSGRNFYIEIKGTILFYYYFLYYIADFLIFHSVILFYTTVLITYFSLYCNLQYNPIFSQNSHRAF